MFCVIILESKILWALEAPIIVAFGNSDEISSIACFESS